MASFISSCRETYLKFSLMLRDQTVVPFVPGCPWTRAYPSRWDCGCTTRTQGLGRNPGRYVYARSQKRPFLVRREWVKNAALSVGRPPLLLSSISLPSPSSPKMVSGSGVQVIFVHGHSLQLVFWVVFGIIDCIFSNSRVRTCCFCTCSCG